MKDPYSLRPHQPWSPARNMRIVTPANADFPLVAKVIWAFVPDDVTDPQVRIVPAGDPSGSTGIIVKLSPGLGPLPPVQIRQIRTDNTSNGVVFYALYDE